MNLLTGDKNLDLMIIERTDDRSLFKLCQINKKYSDELCNEKFWEKRAREKFNVSNKPKEMSWKKYYLRSIILPYGKMISHANKIVSGGHPISKKSVELLISILDPIYEKILTFGKNNFYKQWIEAFGLDTYMLAAGGQQFMYEDIHHYFPQNDKRRVIEFLSEDIIELASIDLNEKEMVRPKHIQKAISESNQLKSLFSTTDQR